MSDTDVQMITGDLDVTTAVAARDAMIASQGDTIQQQTAKIAELDAALLVANTSLAAATARADDLQDKFSSTCADLLVARQALEKAGPPIAPAAPKFRLTAPHAFIDEDTSINHSWRAGQIVTDPDEIALLQQRGAPIEAV